MHSMLTCDKNRHTTADIVDFYPRDVVSGVLATATWLAGWLGGFLSVTAGIVSKQINLS